MLTLPDGRTGWCSTAPTSTPPAAARSMTLVTIGSARVVDVFKDEEHSRLVHVVEGELGLGPVKAQIDAERRLRHMQHHTAQHLLTQCILRQTGFRDRVCQYQWLFAVHIGSRGDPDQQD